MESPLQNPQWWQGRVAFVTGASSGVGLATAQALLFRGCRVGLIARSTEQLEAIAARWGANALVLPADVRDRTALQRQIHSAIDRWGRADILVHSAGVVKVQLCDELDENLRIMFETNTLGAAWATQAVVPAMRQARFGRIVYVGSVDSHVAPVGYAGYSMSKWGLQALAESLGAELGANGISFSVVSPYYVQTPLLESEGKPEELPSFDPHAVLPPYSVAAAILKAVSTGEREIILAPRSVRIGLFLGSLFPGIQRNVLARVGRPLVEARTHQ